MKIVQHELFVNNSRDVNSFLSQFAAEDIVNVSFHVHGTETSSDEYVSVFYRVDKEQTP